jgi:hypothetical protein
MIKKELLEKLKNVPDDAQIEFEEVDSDGIITGEIPAKDVVFFKDGIDVSLLCCSADAQIVLIVS